MSGAIDFKSGGGSTKKAWLYGSVVIGTVLLYAVTAYLCKRGIFSSHVRFANVWALWVSLSSVLSLAAVYWFIQRWVPTMPPDSDAAPLTPPRSVRIVGLTLASIVLTLCLPATFRAGAHPREVMVFWHDEGIALESIQAFVTGTSDTPEYRLTQGWLTFLPVALPLRALHTLVPVHYTLTNIAMRSYQLCMIFFIVYCTYRLIWQISGSTFLSIAVVLIAYSRLEFFNISLAIDRPDTFQLLFVVLCLTHLHRFWVAGQPLSWFFAVGFAGLAFASKYSGHLLTPTLLLGWMVHWRRQAIRDGFVSPARYWLACSSQFFLSIALIFPFSFFVFSPYHLIRYREVITFFQTYLPIYKTANVYNLPDYQAPDRLGLWWGTFTSGYAFDYWMTILALAIAVICLVKNLVRRSESPRVAGEWLLLSWGVCYISFLLYQYGLVDYRYIMPVQYVMPFFLLLPALWLQQSQWLERIRWSPMLGFGVCILCVFLCGERLNRARTFLAGFRDENVPGMPHDQFTVGRTLDRRIGSDSDPKILMTNLAYIPPRFTKLYIHNVDFTMEFIEKNQFDFIITTDNMYTIYANQPTAGRDNPMDPLYKVRFADVVDAYTKFHSKNPPNYRYIESIGAFHLFERERTVVAARSKD